mmetsp:Transcript_1269/g.3079  ORF Transcript_1269/g.3079 Transcript_1269/m.3079 type:complete len:117 (-) Transcript_1269:16-366(-)
MTTTYWIEIASAVLSAKKTMTRASFWRVLAYSHHDRQAPPRPISSRNRLKPSNPTRIFKEFQYPKLGRGRLRFWGGKTNQYSEEYYILVRYRITETAVRNGTTASTPFNTNLQNFD